LVFQNKKQNIFRFILLIEEILFDDYKEFLSDIMNLTRNFAHERNANISRRRSTRTKL